MKFQQSKYEVKRHTLNYKGFKIQLYSCSKGKNTLIALPSFPHSGLTLYSVFSRVNLKNIAFYTLDMPGWIGKSENVFGKGKFDFEVYLEILDKTIKKFNLKNITLVGYSYGGALANVYASRYPEKIKKVVMISPILDGHFLLRGQFKFIKWIDRFKASFFLKHYINYYFKRYKKSMKLSIKEIEIYNKYIANLVSRIAFDSMMYLLNLKSSNLLKGYSDKIKLMIVNSKNEDRCFRDQPKLIRCIVEKEKSIYLKGGHADIIVNPQIKLISKIVSFIRI